MMKEVIIWKQTGCVVLLEGRPVCAVEEEKSALWVAFDGGKEVG